MRTKQRSKLVTYPKKRAQPNRRRVSQTWLYAGIVATAAVTAGVLVLASQLGGAGGKHAAPARSVTGTAVDSRLLAGIPQHGNVLGRPDAPITLVEYADLQCPYCSEFARNALPSLIHQYVRTGRVKLVFRGLAFLGSDSGTALRAVLAAGQSNRLWNVAHLIYLNQGVENTGWVTDDYLRSILRGVPEIDASQILREAQSAKVAREIAKLQGIANADGVTGTPAFSVGRTGGTLQRLQISSLNAAAFRPTLDELLRT